MSQEGFEPSTTALKGDALPTELLARDFYINQMFVHYTILIYFVKCITKNNIKKYPKDYV